MPVVVSTIATVIIFLWVFDPTYGIMSWFLDKLGFGRVGFLESQNGALYSIVGMTVWGWIGFDVIIYLAALQGIPRELVEAAEIDGAGNWGIFRNVTLPLLGPVTLFLVVWSSINALQLFDEIYLATREVRERRRTSSSSTCTTSRSTRGSPATRRRSRTCCSSRSSS